MRTFACEKYKTIRMKKVFGLLVFALLATATYGAGFRVALQSTKQQAMGHVGAGMKVGPSSVFFNPGALALMEKGGVSLSGSAVLGHVSYNQPGTSITSELVDNVGTPFAIYGNFNINEKLAGGLGVYTPYGNKVEWPDDWTGRGISQLVDLKSIFIQPTLSYQLGEKVGIGAGLIYAVGEVTLERGIPALTTVPEPDISLATDGFASGIGFNAGFFYEPTDDMSFGLNYRSKVEVEAEQGIVTTTNIPASAAGLFSGTRFDATLPLPAEVAIGAGWKVSERFTLGADINYIVWSQYKELKFDYNGPIGGSTETIIPQNWEDAVTLKLGGQYMASESLTLRGGGYYDYTPIPDATLAPITPDANRLGLTAGGSYTPGDKLSVDASVLYLRGEERTVLASENIAGFGQRYLNTSVVPSLGFGYSFN